MKNLALNFQLVEGLDGVLHCRFFSFRPADTRP